MEIVETIGLITINGTLLTQAISFLIFLYFINRIMIVPLQATMRERSDHIRIMEESIKQADVKFQGLQLKIEKNERAALREANNQKAKLEKAGADEADRILGGIREEILRTRDKSMKEVDRQIAEASKSLPEEAERLAFTIMEKILDRGVSRE